jgi:hypothetical protein
MRMTHRAEVARRKEHGLQREGKDDIALRTPKGRTSMKKGLKGPECKIGIKNPDTRRQLLHKIERISEEFDRKTFGLEFVKRATGISRGCGK